jgi:hypothetical protein
MLSSFDMDGSQRSSASTDPILGSPRCILLAKMRPVLSIRSVGLEDECGAKPSREPLWTPKLLRISRPGVVPTLAMRSATLLRQTVSEAFLEVSPFRGPSLQPVHLARPAFPVTISTR